MPETAGHDVDRRHLAHSTQALQGVDNRADLVGRRVDSLINCPIDTGDSLCVVDDLVTEPVVPW